jgi:adenosylcobinamide-phosphate synthase
VEQALRAGDLPLARTRVGAIVGRETHDLSPAEVARAAVESVAENSGDGVVAPLFYATLGFLWAPWGVNPALAAATLALGYKAVNTLDSMFGHKDPRHLYFGWASARLDDLVNYLPSRLGALLVVVAAPAAGGDTLRAARTCARDGRRHPSPNSGLFEAAYAGALGVQLGGENRYGDRIERRPHLGEALHPLDAGSIRRALRLLVALSVLATVIAAALTAGFAP